MGRLLNLVAPDPAAAVSRLPQPFRMIDKLVSGIVQGAIDRAVQTESEKLAAEELRDGTKVRAMPISSSQPTTKRLTLVGVRGRAMGRRRESRAPWGAVSPFLFSVSP